MSFNSLVASQQAAIFALMGENALWGVANTPVRILRRDADEDVTFGQTRAVVRTRILRVRQSDLAAPAKDDIVQVLDDDGAVVESLFILAKPMLNRQRAWVCEAGLMPS